MGQHTQTPWFAKREGRSTVYIEARLRPGVLQEVAACGPTEAPEQQEANATLIVRAVNAHEQLVAALKKCAAVCAGETMNKSALIDALDAARKALAAVGAA